MLFLLLGAPPSPQLTARQPGWALDVRYPRFSSHGAPARRANAAARAREREAFDAFLARAKREASASKSPVARARYELRATPHRIADRPGLVSGYAESHARLPGGRGPTKYATLNYGPEGELGLADLFVDPRSAGLAASEALLGIMRAMKSPPSKVASGEWTRLTDDQADRFAVGRLGVLFLFDQGELGAEGAPRVMVPWARLPGVAPWVRKAVR